MSLNRIIPSLYGYWGPPYSDFLWQAAKIFRKSGSENPHDYWISYASGACLASQANYVAGRYDPNTYLLNFNVKGNSAVNGPWKLLPSLNESKELLFFTQVGLTNLKDKKPNLYRDSWIHKISNEELYKLAITLGSRSLFGEFGVLQLQIDRMETVQKDESLPHGSLWGVSYLKSIDENDHRRDRILKQQNHGKLLL
jgi:hypothetical protein